MSSSWMVSLPCTRAQAEALTGDHPALTDLNPVPALVASEEDEARNRWRIDAYFDGKPPRSVVQMLGRALGISAHRLPRAKPVVDADWVTISQAGIAPVRAGRFLVHTGDVPADHQGAKRLLRIDAGLAFGTGGHATTSGCLAMLDQLQATGRRYHDVIDVGTGTGLLAFAALHLWPRAAVMASDIDPASITVSAQNAAINGVPLGSGRRRLSLVIADGVDDMVIAARAPYDLIIANILAGPLIALAPALARVAHVGTTLIMAGLLSRQRAAVVRAARRAGWRLDDNGGDAEWPVLVMSMRPRAGWRRPLRGGGGAGLPPGDFGSW